MLDFPSHQNPSVMRDEGLPREFEKMRQGFNEEELKLSERVPQKLVRHSGSLDAGSQCGVTGLERTIHRRKDFDRIVFHVNVRGISIPIR